MPGPVIRDPFTSPAVPEWARDLRAWIDTPTDWSTPTEYPGVEAAKGVLRGLLRLTGVTDPAAQATALATTNVPKGPPPAPPPGIRAYHGSPHDFPPEPGHPLGRFDISKVGTGQGASSYGHGLYFAEAEPVALDMRNQLAPRPPVLVGGLPVPTTPPTPTGLFGPKEADHVVATRIAAKMQQLRGLGRPIPIDEALAHIDAELEESMYRAVERRDPALWGTLKDQRIALERMREHGIDVPQTGHMYEVNLKVDPQELLDWDRPIAEQSPQVRDAVERALGRRPQWSPGTTGERVYSAIDGGRRAAGIDSPEASQRLLREGVPGLRYLDQYSRGAGWGMFQTPAREAAQAAHDASGQISRNYVMFDDSLIDILRKYGLLPAAVTTGALAHDQVGTPPPTPLPSH